MKKTAARQPKKQQIHLRNIILLILGVLLLYIIVPQVGSFHSSVSVLRDADVAWVAAAILISSLSYFAAALVYVCLAQKPLLYGRTVLVQLASMFTNRLLPAGIGALGTNYQFLLRHRHTKAQALTIVSVNNLLGFVGNILLVVIMVLVTPASLHDLHLPHMSRPLFMTITAVVLLLGVLLFIIFRRRLIVLLKQVVSALMHYRRQPFRLLTALASSMLLTLCYTGCLYAAGQAVGVHLGLVAILICMSAGVAGSTAVPTPGGLGGAEAGLVAGLSAYGVAGSQALAAVLLYRLCTYWLALLAGSIAFITVSRRRYI